MHIHRSQVDRPPDWRREERQIGSNSAYGAWVQVGGDAAVQHLNDLRMARNYTQFGAADPSREAARPRSTTHRSVGEAEASYRCIDDRTLVERDDPQPDPERRSRSSPSQSPAEGRHRSDQPRPPKSLLGNLMGPGDVTPSQGFPGAPGASRGLPNGGHPLWSFERMPSLLHGPLDRDRGKHARSCAGDPPALRAMKEAKEQAALVLQAPPDSPVRKSGQAPRASQGMQQSRSDSSLLSRRPAPKKYSGLQGLVGMTWDDAKVSAGGAVRGSDGRYLGY